MTKKTKGNNWAFIAGGSSGFGLATAKLLASKGFDIFIVHRDLKSNQGEIDEHFAEIKKHDVQLVTINTNVTTVDGQGKILTLLATTLNSNGKIKLFLHSIADGNINPLIQEGNDGSNELSEDDFSHTIQAMGTGFITWSKLLQKNNLFAEDARIIGLTSEGSSRVMPGYAAVAAAKSVMESSCKYLAVEFAQFGITTNLVNAGITDTPALRAFPDHKNLIEKAKNRNPFKRLTQPEDVANVIYLLTRNEAAWINGEIIRVDGGEQIVY